MNRTTALLALAATGLTLTACGTAAGGVTPNGASDTPVNLVSVSYNVSGRSGGDQLVQLTKEATSLSNGSLTLVAGPEPDSGAPDTSADVITAVAENKVQLGIVSARTFDTLGVTSFQALQAPYLVTSNELADKILADPLADKMLAGTDKLGVVGIGLAFDFLAYPGGYGTPVLAPADYRGGKFQVRPSKANDLLTAALGASSDPRNGQALEAAVGAGDVRGGWGYFDAPSQPVPGEIFTANEPAFARANVIIVNQKVFDGLSPTQQAQLRQAAARTRDWMAGRHTDPAATAAAYCATNGGSIAVSSAADLDAMRTATAPVVAQLERDALTAEVIARIRELKTGVTAAATPVACTAGAAATAPVPVLAAKGDQKAIDGVWRLNVDADSLLAAGVAQVDAANNAGIWTWTFKNGTFRYVEPRGRSCDGNYTLNGDRLLSVVTLPLGCDNVWPMTFSRDGDRLTLALTPGIPPGLPVEGDPTRYEPDPGSASFFAAFFHDALVRVGDAP